MEEAIVQIRNSIVNGRTDILNALLLQCRKLGHDVKDVLRSNVLPEGTFLHLATSLGQQDIVRALLNSGADPSIENKQDENAFELCPSESIRKVYIGELLRAIANSDIARMEDFFKAGVDPNSWDCEEKRNSLLHWAVSFANTETVAFLIDRGAHVNSTTSESVTPLHDAVDRSNVPIIELLLKANASPLIKAEQGKFENSSPLDLASRKPEIFSLLSQFLASQFKTRQLQHRSSSIDSVSSALSPDLSMSGSEHPGTDMDPQPLYSSHESFKPILHSGFDNNLERIIRGMELTAPIQPIVTDSRLSKLWPQPKTLMCLEGLQFRPEKTLHISVIKSTVSVHRILDVFSSYKAAFELQGFAIICSKIEGNRTSASQAAFHSSQVHCAINEEVFQAKSSYKIHVSSLKVKILASDVNGLRYGISTFLQLLTLFSNPDEPTAIPPMVIKDQPSLKHRGVFIDVSSERIPSIESLSNFIRSLCLFKINYVHLHIRFGNSCAQLSYSKGELLAIDRLCSDVGIELIPAIDVSSDLTVAEYFQHVKPELSDFLLCFASTSYVHVGPYLTTLIFTLENGQSERCGSFNAIWDFIPVSPADSTILLCYNAIENAIQNRTASRVSLSDVPVNVVLVEYGFQADYNFAPSLQTLAQNGCSTIVMAGTCAWSSLAGCPEAALCNLYHGSSNAIKSSSLGLIVANWSGSCNLTPRIFGWPGFLLLAGLSWNPKTHWEYLQGSLSELLSTYILNDMSGIGGQVILQLGTAEFTLFRGELSQSVSDMSNLPPSQGTTLYRFLTSPDNVSFDNLTLDHFMKCVKAIKKCHSALLFDCKMEKQNNPAFSELCLTIDMMLLAARIGRQLLSAGVNPRSNMGLAVVNLGVANLAPTVRSDLANKLLTSIDEYQRVWTLTNYSDGLETSLHSLTTTLQRFIPDSSRLMTGRRSFGSEPMTNGVSTSTSTHSNGRIHRY